MNIIIPLLLFFAACKKTPVPDKPLPPMAATPVVKRVIQVTNATELKAALLDARAGDEIRMADGVYKGKFVVAAGVSGTAAFPITLKGSRNVVLDADNITTGYVLYLQSDYWNVRGFTVTNGLKGIMADGIHHCTIDSVRVFNIGEEAIHLRKFSSQNTIVDCEITQTGLKTPDYGEGIYIGSAKSNWSTYTNGNPDLCDSNRVVSNRIGPGIAAECIDIKEGTTGGLIQSNYFDASGITGANSADSWLDVKGNNYLIENNTGYNPAGSVLKDGFQVNVAATGWGNFNVFKNNQCAVNASGYGFLIKLSSSNGNAVGNQVYASNTVTGAASGVSNIALTN